MGSLNSSTRQSTPPANIRPQNIVSVSETPRFSRRSELERVSNVPITIQRDHVPPRLDIQQTCVVKNPVNLKKKSLSIDKDPVESHIYYLDFSFDAATPVEVCIYFECKETIDVESGIPKFESENAAIVHEYPEGMNQHYRSTKEESLNLLNHHFQDINFNDESPPVFPVIIQLRALGNSSLVQSQCTYASLFQTIKEEQNVWTIQPIKQKIQYGQKCFEVQEIFGIERATSKGSYPDEFLSGRECVICLAEDRNTAVLPCRHMCLCSGCANVMRLQSNKCPICRQSVNSLLQISVNEKSKSCTESACQAE